MQESNALTEESLDYPGWRVAGASGVGVLVSFASLLVYTFGIFLKPLTGEFGWTRESVSLAFGIAAMSVAVCSPVLGVLLDRYGPRRIIVPCIAVFGMAFASLSLLTPHLWHLYLTFVVLGVVGNGTAQMAYSRAVSTWFKKRRGMAFAILMTGGAVGAIILPPAAEFLIRNLGWRGAFAVLGAMVLVVGLPVVGLFVREEPSTRTVAGKKPTGSTVAEGLRSRPFWILVVVLFLSSISQNAAITHLSALLTDRGISGGGAALAVSAMGAASVLGRLGTGWLLDRYFAPRISFGLLAISALGVVVLANASTLAMGAMGAALIGMGMGGEADVTPFVLSKYVGLRSFATLYGFTWTAYAIAGAIGPVLMGKAFDITHSYQTFLWQVAGLTLVAACLMLLMPRYPEPVERLADPVSESAVATV